MPLKLDCPSCKKKGTVIMWNEGGSYWSCKACKEHFTTSGDPLRSVWQKLIKRDKIECPHCNDDNIEPSCAYYKTTDWFCITCQDWFNFLGPKKVIASVKVTMSMTNI